MSFGVVGQLLRCVGIAAAVSLAVPGVSWGQVRAGFGTGISCAPCCQTHHCPPAFKHCQEGPPCIHFKHGCPHPVCNPCDLPHWGYFETCWTPYPFPSDWLHCPTPPPAAFVGLGTPQNMFRMMPMTPNMLPPSGAPGVPNGNGIEELPRPNVLPNSRPGLQ